MKKMKRFSAISGVVDALFCQIEKSIESGSPLGETGWITETAGELGLESTMRPRGRLRK